MKIYARTYDFSGYDERLKVREIACREPVFIEHFNLQFVFMFVAKDGNVGYID